MATKKATQKKTRPPREARTFNQIVGIPRDNVATPGYWFMLGGEGFTNRVTIAKQRTGEAAEWMVHVPRRDFERFIDWYNTGKWGKRHA